MQRSVIQVGFGITVHIPFCVSSHLAGLVWHFNCDFVFFLFFRKIGKASDDDDDDDFFGPALPPGFKKRSDSPDRYTALSGKKNVIFAEF